MDVQNFLSKIIKLKVANDSSSSNLDSIKSFSLIGYGPLHKSSQLAIETNFGTFAMISRRYPHYANWEHALDELMTEDPEYISINKVLRLIRRSIRAISIGASRGSHFAGIWNGFIWKASIPGESIFIKLAYREDSTIHISRRASRIGLIVTDYSREMERVFRRGLDKDSVYITSYKGWNPRQQYKYPDSLFPNLALGVCSSNIEVMSDYTQLLSSEVEGGVNSYFRLQDTTITPQGILFRTSLNGPLKLLNLTTTDYWPSPFWKSKVEEKFLSPTVEGIIEVSEPASFMSWSSNWAHFVEDNLPSILGLIQKDPLREIFCIGRISRVQDETLKILFPDSTFNPMLEGHAYRFKDVLINIHTDSRNLRIAGSDSEIDMVDEARLREIRDRILSSVEVEPINDLKLFIVRRAGFRKLINRQRIEKIFQDSGFTLVQAEHLGLMDRVNLLQKAKIVAGETGAGLVNLYFCKDQTSVIELRHPSVSESREHHVLVSITSHDYHKVQGRSIGFWKKLRYGSDAYIADEGEILDLLQKFPR